MISAQQLEDLSENEVHQKAIKLSLYCRNLPYLSESNLIKLSKLLEPSNSISAISASDEPTHSINSPLRRTNTLTSGSHKRREYRMEFQRIVMVEAELI
jgi:hypothetical protein